MAALSFHLTRDDISPALTRMASAGADDRPEAHPPDASAAAAIIPPTRLPARSDVPLR